MLQLWQGERLSINIQHKLLHNYNPLKHYIFK